MSDMFSMPCILCDTLGELLNYLICLWDDFPLTTCHCSKP